MSFSIAYRVSDTVPLTLASRIWPFQDDSSYTWPILGVRTIYRAKEMTQENIDADQHHHKEAGNEHHDKDSALILGGSKHFEVCVS